MNYALLIGANAVIYGDEGRPGAAFRSAEEKGWVGWPGDRLVHFQFRSSNKNPNQESSRHESRLWRPALAFELEFTTFLCPSVLKDQFPAHPDSFRWITVN